MPAAMDSKSKVSFGFPSNPPKKPAAMFSHNEKEIETHITIMGRKEDQNELKKLTPHWVQSHGMSWPQVADFRLYRFMHEQDSYHRKLEILHLNMACQFLTQGTMIEGCQSSIQEVLLYKVAKRMHHLHDEMVKTDVIEFRNGRYQKTREFFNIWQSRTEYWPPSNANETANNKRSLSDDAGQGESTTGVQDPPGTGGSSDWKKDLMVLESAPSSPLSVDSYRISPSLSEKNVDCGKKRQKVSGTEHEQQRHQLQTTSFASTAPPSADMKTNADPAEIASSQIKPPTPPKTPERNIQIIAIQTPPTTPATPSSRTPHPLAQGQMMASPTTISRTPGWAKSKSSSTSPQTAFVQPSRPPKNVNTTITITVSIFIKAVAGNYDLENPVPATILRDSSVQQFFEIFSRRSGITLADLKFLRFIHNIQGRKMNFISRQCNAEEWEKFKEGLRDRVSVSKQDNEKKTKFRILIAAGNDDGEEGGEDLGGL
ncbi:uncharacterized protein PAC_08426 [Phialocephala subalpina]|uniref:Uncharacterized protein n=1 Tax=Phialocephala subalpina TaxID=576137 RepID=A0A1L7X0J2_9HELO|nr:uncharacterized protein PAC_08426 [Phialocephala subalpina]